ncbi:Chloroperoxidase [Coprinopsis sp. MPI-PUGE-AT-0042]|nr:Chloroperoxidase [Coprinopsis sp. MPI-PUGE-AT-0042]
MVGFRSLIVAGLAGSVFAFPAYQSLSGISERDLEELIPSLPIGFLKPPPGPLKNNGTRLVADPAHPFIKPGPLDIRGPCPGLNTLANHGYLPRSGIASPQQIVEAVMEGFNMENGLAIFVTYAAFIVDGNPITNLMSIGGKTIRTGIDPPKPAIVGGLNTHAVFEGDTSMTRGDFYHGDNHSLNTTLWAQFIDYSNTYGGGFYDLPAAHALRTQRIAQSLATNPQFDFTSPRYFTAFAESVFPLNFFRDGRIADGKLDLASAESFFIQERFPKDFHRKPTPGGVEGFDYLAERANILPGRNNGTVNNYVPDPDSANFGTFCLLYQNFVSKTIKGLYPNPKGLLKYALNTHLDYFYKGFGVPTCPQVFPWGK